MNIEHTRITGWGIRDDVGNLESDRPALGQSGIVGNFNDLVSNMAAMADIGVDASSSSAPIATYGSRRRSGGPGRDRTCDPGVMSPVLCH